MALRCRDDRGHCSCRFSLYTAIPLLQQLFDRRRMFPARNSVWQRGKLSRIAQDGRTADGSREGIRYRSLQGVASRPPTATESVSKNARTVPENIKIRTISPVVRALSSCPLGLIVTSRSKIRVETNCFARLLNGDCQRGDFGQAFRVLTCLRFRSSPP